MKKLSFVIPVNEYGGGGRAVSDYERQLINNATASGRLLQLREADEPFQGQHAIFLPLDSLIIKAEPSGVDIQMTHNGNNIWRTNNKLSVGSTLTVDLNDGIHCFARYKVS